MYLKIVGIYDTELVNVYKNLVIQKWNINKYIEFKYNGNKYRQFEYSWNKYMKFKYNWNKYMRFKYNWLARLG